MSAREIQPMEDQYFVAHMFQPEQNDDLRDAISHGLCNTGLRPIYGDDIYRGEHLLGKLLEMISTSLFGVYDLTGCRPNVLLELGVGIACRKPIYLLCKDESDIPSDIRGIEHIQYESTRVLIEALKKKIAPRWSKPLVDLTDDMVRKHAMKFYQAETLHHRTGEEVADEIASNRRAWRFGPNLPLETTPRSMRLQHAVFGPYEHLPRQGLYKAYFRMKINDNSRPEDVLVLDVTSSGNPELAKSKAVKTIRGIDFPSPEEYQVFSLPFAYGMEDDLEYRAHQCADNVVITLDYIAVTDAANENDLAIPKYKDTRYEESKIKI